MSDRFFFEGTEDKPRIDFDPHNNIFEINGNSYPEESSNFYIPLLQWLENYVENPNKHTHLICKLEYYNSLSAKFLFEIFLTLQKIKQTGNQINITWYYNKDDNFIQEKGEEYKSAIEIPFEIKLM